MTIRAFLGGARGDARLLSNHATIRWYLTNNNNNNNNDSAADNDEYEPLLGADVLTIREARTAYA